MHCSPPATYVLCSKAASLVFPSFVLRRANPKEETNHPSTLRTFVEKKNLYITWQFMEISMKPKGL